MMEYLSQLENIFKEEASKFENLGKVDIFIRVHSTNAPFNNYLYELYIKCNKVEYSVFIKDCYCDTTKKQHRRFNDISKRLSDIQSGTASVIDKTEMYLIYPFDELFMYSRKQILTLQEALKIKSKKIIGVTIENLKIQHEHILVKIEEKEYLSFYECIYSIC